MDEALWAFRIAYKAPIGTIQFRLVYGKACHLSVEVEHKAFWAFKTLNCELNFVGQEWLWQLNELDEWILMAYKS